MRQPLSFLAVVACAALALVPARLLAGPPANPANPANTGQVAKAVFQVQGMTCSGCEAGVEIAVKKLPGIKSVKASYDKGRAEVSYRPSLVGVQKIQQAIERLGYKAKLMPPEEATAVNETAVKSVERAPVAAKPALRDNLSLRDIDNLEDLATLFRQTQGQPRIVLLLSPT